MPFSKSLIFEKSMRTKREIFWWYSLSSIKLSLYELFIKLVSNFQVNFSLKIMASPHDQPPGVQVGQDLLLDQDKSSQKSRNNPEAVFNSPGISSLPSPCTVSASSTTSGPRFGSSGSSSRQKNYLFDQFPCTVKLPKIILVMRCFFGHVLNQQ